MKKNILFITRNGLLEPLGQSQILSYLIPLSKDFSVNIISFEKASDIRNIALLDNIKSICVANNINWRPLTYRKTLRSLGILIGFIELFFKAMKVCKVHNIDLIHARSYYPTFITLLIHRLKKIPFIFDMRALWPEELVTAGRLKQNSLAFNIIKSLERKSLKKSAAVVSLTKAAVPHLVEILPKLKQKIAVIPTCTNLERFKLNSNKVSSDNLTISCVGTLLSGWFKMNILKRVVHYLFESYPNVTFEILTRDNQEKILEELQLKPEWQNRIKIGAVPFAQMPERVSNHDGSMFFFNADISKLGSCPTRMGELLGCGVPVLANPGVGDVESIISENNVGVLINNESDEAIANACEAFVKLISEKDISLICRNTSQKLFSLNIGVQHYKAIYTHILDNKSYSNL
jgi:glycosyltransferase involved in cell wall biosynthesis